MATICQAAFSQQQILAEEIRIRAERKAGQLIIKMLKSGELASKGQNQGGPKAKKDLERSRSLLTLADIGVEYWESQRWQQLAQPKEKEFDALADEADWGQNQGGPKAKKEADRSASLLTSKTSASNNGNPPAGSNWPSPKRKSSMRSQSEAGWDASIDAPRNSKVKIDRF